MNVLDQLKHIDFGTFLDFPASGPNRNQPVVKILEDGRVFLYGELRKRAAEGRRDYRARISPDGRYVALYPELSPNLRFRADGSGQRNEALLKLLREKEIQIPATYEMEWVEAETAWVGCCKELPEPDLAAIRQAAKRAQRRKEL